MSAISEVLDVANAFNTELKVAWVVWLAWGVGQAFWYKRERSSAAKPRVRAAARAPRKTEPKQHKVVPAVGRLITPAHVEASPKVRPEVPLAPPAPFQPPAPAFDPAKAVVETFDARNHEELRHNGELRHNEDLDAIVADMEAHMPPTGDGPHVH